MSSSIANWTIDTLLKTHSDVGKRLWTDFNDFNDTSSKDPKNLQKYRFTLGTMMRSIRNYPGTNIGIGHLYPGV